MSSLPKISIITPSFNQGVFVEDTILSVLNQNYPNLEYIIIDGGSTDSSVDIIQKYNDQLAYWVSEEDRGQSHALNKGFKKATGDIIAWINSDDYYLPDTLLFVAEIFEKYPDVDIIYGDVINFTGKKEFYYKVAEFEPLDFLSRISIHQPGVFWRTSLLEKVGFLNETLHYAMDYDLWMRLFFSYKSLKIDKPFAKFRMHAGSKTTDAPPELYKECREIVSTFFNSVASVEQINRLKQLDVYCNPDNKIYKLNIADLSFLPKAADQYVFNYAIEEHTFGDKKKANSLFWISLKKGYFKSIYFLLKNQF
ncbi:MAG: glycosyltransferase family 2 protein [Salinivirgaceae bacterium]|jgi:glycosyltransferase involved in cell wall biosynthesis|nr:glycosyltransferase family 2 protein [Salinivirgaceae bacterium]